MGEKKGKTVKLIYDFPTQLCTEVFDCGVWSRATCRHFRSFNGPRRILKFNRDGSSYYEDYNGPVFMYETNIRLKDMNKKGYIYPNDEMPKSKARLWEFHSTDGKI